MCGPIAEDPRLIEMVTEVGGKLGVVGEKPSIVTVYLTASSRLNRRKAMSLLRRGSAAGGKSFVVEQVLKLFPSNQIIETAGGSPKALPYYGEGENALAHHIVYAVEIDSLIDPKTGGNEFAPMMRKLISENRVVYQTVVLRERALPITINIRKNGPIAVLATAVQVPDNNDELLTRLAIDGADESDAQNMRNHQLALA